MNKLVLGLASVFFVSIAFHAEAQLPGKVQITTQKKKGEGVRGKAGSAGSEARSSENQSYSITLQNRTQADLANLTVDYIIFVERQKLGEKKGRETVERVKGTLNVPSLSRQPQEVATSEVTLMTENVVGNYIYPNGGRIRAEDSLVGIWVRVSQDGKMIAEYGQPSTIINRGWDKQ